MYTVFLVSACVTLAIIPPVSRKPQDESKQKGWTKTWSEELPSHYGSGAGRFLDHCLNLPQR